MSKNTFDFELLNKKELEDKIIQVNKLIDEINNWKPICKIINISFKPTKKDLESVTKTLDNDSTI